MSRHSIIYYRYFASVERSIVGMEQVSVGTEAVLQGLKQGFVHLLRQEDYSEQIQLLNS